MHQLCPMPLLLVQVVLPSALVGGPSMDDPELRRLHMDLKEVNRKLLNNELDIPPESERSPSPEPQYDRNGIRLNTRHKFSSALRSLMPVHIFIVHTCRLCVLHACGKAIPAACSKMLCTV